MIVAFAEGIISFLSPSVLPHIPGCFSYVAGYSIAERLGGGAAVVRLHAVAIGAS